MREGITFIQFPDPSMEKAKAERWIAACRRENFTINSITRWTYMCNKHFVDPSGPTRQNPDPVPASMSKAEADNLRKRQRKSKPRPAILSKKQKLDIAETILTLQDCNMESSTIDSNADLSSLTTDITINKTTEQVCYLCVCVCVTQVRFTDTASECTDFCTI